MRGILMLLMVALVSSACNQNRVYHEYVDLDDRHWLVNTKPEFTFTVEDTLSRYNVYCNLRNSTHYPYSRIFIRYSLQDSTGAELQKKLLHDYLFDAKSGKPFGRSGLGDLYDHQLLMLNNYQFKHSGPYKIQFEQFMRTDTLAGVLSVGLAVEKIETKD